MWMLGCSGWRIGLFSVGGWAGRYGGDRWRLAVTNSTWSWAVWVIAVAELRRLLGRSGWHSTYNLRKGLGQRKSPGHCVLVEWVALVRGIRGGGRRSAEIELRGEDGEIGT
jgi:hypothetical protein